MDAQEFFNRPLIEIRCINIGAEGKRCMSFLGDMVHGVHTVQNFKCPSCRVEWLVEKDKTDAVVFRRVPRSTKKSYRKDTGLRMELPIQQSLAPSMAGA